MYLIFLDTETTGVNPEKHRVLEIAYKIVDSVSGHILISYESIVAQPAAVWAEADPESLGVNGFYWEEVLGGTSEKEVASEISNDFNHVKLGEHGGVFVCQNPSFDRSYFNQLISVELQEHFGWPYHWLDLASMYWAVMHMKEPEKARNLVERSLSKNQIAEQYHISPEERPHRAMNGVNHLMACYEAILGKIGS